MPALLREMRRSETIEATKGVTIAKKGSFFEELLRTSKKLVLILAISVPVTDNSEEIVITLPYIY